MISKQWSRSHIDIFLCNRESVADCPTCRRELSTRTAAIGAGVTGTTIIGAGVTCCPPAGRDGTIGTSHTGMSVDKFRYIIIYSAKSYCVKFRYRTPGYKSMGMKLDIHTILIQSSGGSRIFQTKGGGRQLLTSGRKLII